MKQARILSLVLLAFATPAVLHAQHGCYHSPEAPTDVLLLVGTAGMVFGSSVARRILRRPR